MSTRVHSALRSIIIRHQDELRPIVAQYVSDRSQRISRGLGRQPDEVDRRLLDWLLRHVPDMQAVKETYLQSSSMQKLIEAVGRCRPKILKIKIKNWKKQIENQVPTQPVVSTQPGRLTMWLPTGESISGSPSDVAAFVAARRTL